MIKITNCETIQYAISELDLDYTLKNDRRWVSYPYQLIHLSVKELITILILKHGHMLSARFVEVRSVEVRSVAEGRPVRRWDEHHSLIPIGNHLKSLMTFGAASLCGSEQTHCNDGTELSTNHNKV